MKLFKYGLPFAALAVLASCSNDNLDAPQDGGSKFVPGETTYMNLTISLPEFAGTKADGLQDYDKSYDTEYNLNDGWIYLFAAGGDDNGKCLAKGYIDVKGLANHDKPDITGTLNFYGIPIDSEFDSSNKPSAGWTPQDNVNYNALIILNQGLNNEGITPPAIDQTYDNWVNSVKESTTMPMMFTPSGGSTTYFTMTNALGWAGDATLTPAVPNALVSVDGSYLYQGTNNDPSKVVTFYVQRVVSKVSLGTGGITVGGEAKVVKGWEEQGYPKVKLTAWDLNKKNSKTFPVQQIDGAFIDNYITNWTSLATKRTRFLGNNADGFRRIYWAVDPNYSDYADEFSQLSDLSNTSLDPKYCFENTFDLANMEKNQSTSIVFKAEYNVSSTGATTAPSFLAFGPNFYELSSVNDLKSTKNQSSCTGTLDDLMDDGEKIKAAKAALKCSDDDIVTFYLNGVCYYNVIIRHFADSELDAGFYADWAFTGKYFNNTTPGPDDLDHYLGRYGMVRNNWYEIVINTISGPGETDIPEPGDDPDDDPNPYKLDLTINILNWAKRVHGYDL